MNRKNRDWTIVILFTLFIFISPQYLRYLQNFLEKKFGNQVYYGITAVALLIAIYFFRRIIISPISDKKERLIWFFILSLIYAYTFFQLKVLVEREHLIKYGFLAYFVFRAISNSVKDKTAYLLTLLTVYIIGIFEEGIQWQLPNRVGEYKDVILNGKSGLLGTAVIYFILKPEFISKQMTIASLRWVILLLISALCLTSLFLTLVHHFGHVIKIDSVGEFVSNFSPQDLLSMNEDRCRIIYEVIRGINHDQNLFMVSSLARAGDRIFQDPTLYNYEVHIHLTHRDNYLKKKEWRQAWVENQILEKFYGVFMKMEGRELSEEQKIELQKEVENSEPIYFKSQVNNQLFITWISKRNLWILTIIICLCLWIIFTYFDLRVNS